MDTKAKVTIPVYQQISIDIATKIVEKHYSVGDKIYTRSSIASQYGVSSETARRAISILSDLEIVGATKGSGVIIKSYEKAVAFVRQYHDIQTINNLKKEILVSVEKQAKETEFLVSRISTLIEKTDRFRSINPFVPFEIGITNECPYLNRTIQEMNFWHNTAATIIAIRRKGELLMSPGPHAVFLADDVLFFIGDDNCLERVKNFIFPN